nr:transmembrane protein 14C isoform X2 [Ovis aries]
MPKDSGPLVPLHWLGFGYAALVASGGIIGYAKAEMSVCQKNAGVCVPPSRQCSVPGCRAPLRWSRWPGFLSAVSGSEERLAFLSHIWNLGWHHGDEILQL